MKKVSDSRAAKIRSELFRLVDNRLIELGCDSFVEFHRKHPGGDEPWANRGLFPEPLCPFINRLCPDDLCFLPAGHVGTVEGFHITGTVAYDWAVQWQDGDNLGPMSASREDLIRMGCRLAEQDAELDAR